MYNLRFKLCEGVVEDEEKYIARLAASFMPKNSLN